MTIRLSARDDPTRLSKPPPFAQQPSPGPTNQTAPPSSKTLQAQSARRRREPAPNCFFPA
jgi:hypothetical protein